MQYHHQAVLITVGDQRSRSRGKHQWVVPPQGVLHGWNRPFTSMYMVNCCAVETCSVPWFCGHKQTRLQQHTNWPGNVNCCFGNDTCLRCRPHLNVVDGINRCKIDIPCLRHSLSAVHQGKWQWQVKGQCVCIWAITWGPLWNFAISVENGLKMHKMLYYIVININLHFDRPKSTAYQHTKA